MVSKCTGEEIYGHMVNVWEKEGMDPKRMAD